MDSAGPFTWKKCLLPGCALRHSLVWLPSFPYLVGVFAVGDKVVRYLLPVEWVGFVSIAIGFESLALSLSCGLAKA